MEKMKGKRKITGRNEQKDTISCDQTNVSTAMKYSGK